MLIETSPNLFIFSLYYTLVPACSGVSPAHSLSLPWLSGATLSLPLKKNTLPGSLPIFSMTTRFRFTMCWYSLFPWAPNFSIQIMGVKSPKRSKGNLLSSLSNWKVHTILIQYHYISLGLIRSLLVILDSLDPFAVDTYLRLKGFGVSQISCPMDSKGVPKQL